MSVIAELAKRLAHRVARLCAQCGAPGWGIVGVERGLPCEACGAATELAQAEIWAAARAANAAHCRARGDEALSVVQSVRLMCRCARVRRGPGAILGAQEALSGDLAYRPAPR